MGPRFSAAPTWSPFSVSYDPAIRHGLQAASSTNLPSAALCSAIGPANPCTNATTLHLPAFADGPQPPDAIPEAGAVWSALMNLLRSPYHGLHGAPAVPLATRTQLLPNGSPDAPPPRVPHHGPRRHGPPAAEGRFT